MANPIEKNSQTENNRIIGPIRVQVLCRNIETAEVVNTSSGDYRRRSFQNWVSRTILWAVANNHSVNISPIKEISDD